MSNVTTNKMKTPYNYLLGDHGWAKMVWDSLYQDIKYVQTGHQVAPPSDLSKIDEKDIVLALPNFRFFSGQ